MFLRGGRRLKSGLCWEFRLDHCIGASAINWIDANVKAATIAYFVCLRTAAWGMCSHRNTKSCPLIYSRSCEKTHLWAS